MEPPPPGSQPGLAICAADVFFNAKIGARATCCKVVCFHEIQIRNSLQALSSFIYGFSQPRGAHEKFEAPEGGPGPLSYRSGLSKDRPRRPTAERADGSRASAGRAGRKSTRGPSGPTEAGESAAEPCWGSKFRDAVLTYFGGRNVGPQQNLKVGLCWCCAP